MADMHCQWCGAEMRLIDRDYYPEGDFDNYWLCDNCNVGCKERFSGSKPVRETWTVIKASSSVIPEN